jgi:hypothetical protein
LLAIKAVKDSAMKELEMVPISPLRAAALAFLAASSVTTNPLTARALSAAYWRIYLFAPLTKPPVTDLRTLTMVVTWAGSKASGADIKEMAPAASY